MNWSSTSGTDPADVGPGLETYAASHNYSNTFTAEYYDVSADRSGTWDSFKSILDSGCPVIYLYHSDSAVKYNILYGYWEDGTVLYRLINDSPTPVGVATTPTLDWFDYYPGDGYQIEFIHFHP